MKFTKMHGCGNDFLVVDGPAELDVPRVREICDRRRGVGADGILVIGAPEGRRWPVILHNADGSLGESCGNGARCVARYLLDRHGGDVLNLRFAGGDVSARREGDCIAITLGAPTRPEPVAVDGVRRAYLMNVGNRHVVLLVEDPATVDLPAVAAAACEHRMEDTVRVQVSGGELLVRRRAGRDTFELAGPAEYAFEGRVD